MPNGIALGPTVFTQWRAQQGGGILRPSGIGETVTFLATSKERYVLAKNS